MRAELARKVARLWEEQLKDPREAADAWRRVLRMKPGDLDAQGGLERAKTAMLSQPKPEPVAPSAAQDEEPAPTPAEAAPERLGAVDEGPPDASPSEEVTVTGIDMASLAEAERAIAAGREEASANAIESAVNTPVPASAEATEGDDADLSEALAGPADAAPSSSSAAAAHRAR